MSESDENPQSSNGSHEPEEGVQAQGSSNPEPSSGDGTEGAASPGTEEALAEALAERDKLKEQLLRTAADFDNFRKRARRDIDETERRAREETLREVLPVIDNLERAASASEGAQDVQSVAEGVNMVLKQFHDTAEKIGLQRIQAVGERFDPNRHDAIQQQESTEHPPGTVMAEVVPGYMLGDRLLRAAVVVVAKAPSDESASEE